MKINGLQIRETIKMKKLELAAVLSTFEESTTAFAGETKQNPKDVMERAFQLELQITRLQAMQSEYNLNVEVAIEETSYSLEHIVKLIGGVSRIAKKWRDNAKGEKIDRYSRREMITRSKDSERAIPTVTKEESLNEAKRYEKIASHFRSAITRGNLAEIEVGDTDAELFK